MYTHKRSLSTTLKKFRKDGPFTELVVAGLQAGISLVVALLLTSAFLA